MFNEIQIMNLKSFLVLKKIIQYVWRKEKRYTYNSKRIVIEWSHLKKHCLIFYIHT